MNVGTRMGIEIRTLWKYEAKSEYQLLYTYRNVKIRTGVNELNQR